jgi:DNA-binding transcriptional MerR regulator
MEYTVQELANLAGVSARTLRYYDKIGLLKPARINASGYRIYGLDEVDHLQQILFYKTLGVGLREIKKILSSPSYDRLKALQDYRNQLFSEKKRLDTLIANVEKTIASIEGGIQMTDQEKFEGLKQQILDENEAKYGKEIRAKYGDDVINQSNAKVKRMTKEQYEEMARLEKEVLEWLEKSI